MSAEVPNKQLILAQGAEQGKYFEVFEYILGYRKP
jgi:hypothetical protein